MLDFPDHTACIVWLSGCNMRCLYCHNPQIVRGKGRGTEAEVISFLEKRRGLLDGVVLSGGEATAYPDIVDFAERIKSLGFAVKLDTNGLRPDVLVRLLDRALVDYIALDYKASASKFKKVTGADKYNRFQETLEILCGQNAVPFEIRTTVHTGLIDEHDVNGILQDLSDRNFSGTYYLQNFIVHNDRPVLGPLSEQTRVLDFGKLIFPRNIKVNFRNFPPFDSDQGDGKRMPAFSG